MSQKTGKWNVMRVLSGAEHIRCPEGSKSVSGLPDSQLDRTTRYSEDCAQVWLSGFNSTSRGAKPLRKSIGRRLDGEYGYSDESEPDYSYY